MAGNGMIPEPPSVTTDPWGPPRGSLPMELPMDFAYRAATLLSVLLFLHYGLSCLFSDGMVAEFRRFGLSRFRRLTGTLEVLGALGLVIGLLVPVFTLLASAGLALLMLLGVFTRIRVRDSVLETLPAAILLGMNLFIFLYALGGGGVG